MNTRISVEDFLSQKNIAVVGVSRSGDKFSNTAYKELKNKGYNVMPVNPKADTIDGEPCFHSLADIAQAPDGALVITPPKETENVVRDAIKAGVKRLWIQQGAESEEALKLCEENGISVVNGECVLMFAEPAAFYHKIHRWVWKLLGKLPR